MTEPRDSTDTDEDLAFMVSPRDETTITQPTTETEVVGRTGPKSKYPWSAWQNGKRYRINPGQYDLSAAQLQMRLHNRARLQGVVVATSVQDNGDLLFQFFETKKDLAASEWRNEG